MIVIMIMVILFSVGMANYRGFQRRQSLEAAVRQVRADLSLAREYALAGRKVCDDADDELSGYDFDIDASADTYTIREVCLDDPTDDTSQEYFDVKSDVDMPSRSEISSDVDPILFNVLGRGADLGGNATITITDASGDTRTVIVTPAGEIR